METINDRIALILKDLGISKTDFSKKVKVSQQYISKLVTEGNPSEMLKDNICEKFGISKEWLETGLGDIRKPAEDKLSSYVSEITDGDDEFIKDLIEVYMELDDSCKLAIRTLAKGMVEKHIKREQK